MTKHKHFAILLSVIINTKEKNMTDDKPSKVEKVIAYLFLQLARLALATLAFAGMVHLIGGVDPIIAYPISVVSIAFLVKETL